MAASDLAASCFDGADGELLGLGVRIGNYLQVLSAIANLRLDTEDAPGGAWLQVFTAVPILAFGLKSVLEGTISNAMFLATAYIGWMQLLIMPAVLLLPAIRCLMLLVLLISGSILWSLGVLIWYYATGYERLEIPACATTYAFFFAKVPAFGWFRWLNIGVLGLAAATYIVLLALLLPRTRISRALMDQLRRNFSHPLRICAALVVVWIILILGTELTLHWNDVSGVYSLNSTGQLIPLLVGAGVIARDIYFSWARTRACLAEVHRPQLHRDEDAQQLHGAKTSVV